MIKAFFIDFYHILFPFSGLKMVIMSSAILGGIMAHYGFPPDQWALFRADLPWWGNWAIVTNITFLVIGLLKKD